MRSGSECEEQESVLCEHQSCYTVEGEECLESFTYKGVQYHQCTSVDVYKPWCATGDGGLSVFLLYIHGTCTLYICTLYIIVQYMYFVHVTLYFVHMTLYIIDHTFYINIIHCTLY